MEAKPWNKWTEEELADEAQAGLRGQGAVVEIMRRLKQSDTSDTWLAYYWALLKEFGAECLHISRSDMLASALAIGFVFLINRSDLDLRVGIKAAIATFATLGILHSVRVPWLRLRRVASHETELPLIWGVLGALFLGALLSCVAYAALWFYTMQPPVVMKIGPDGNNQRIAQLQASIEELRNKLPDERSLKLRSLEAADEFERFWRHLPKEPTCKQTSSMTPEEQRKAIEPCAEYFNKRTLLYQQTLGPKIMAIVAEFKGKGANVLNIENCAAVAYCGISVAVQLRALSIQLDARDNLGD
jgi:hypothetical protein